MYFLIFILQITNIFCQPVSSFEDFKNFLSSMGCGVMESNSDLFIKNLNENSRLIIESIEKLNDNKKIKNLIVDQNVNFIFKNLIEFRIRSLCFQCLNCQNKINKTLCFSYFVKQDDSNDDLTLICQTCFSKKIFGLPKDSKITFIVENQVDNFFTFKQSLYTSNIPRSIIDGYTRNIYLIPDRVFCYITHKQFFNNNNKDYMKDFLRNLKSYYRKEMERYENVIKDINLYAIKLARVSYFIEEFKKLPEAAKDYIDETYKFKNTIINEWNIGSNDEFENIMLLDLFMTIQIIKFGNLMKNEGFSVMNLIQNPCYFFKFINTIYQKYDKTKFCNLLKVKNCNPYYILKDFSKFISSCLNSNTYSYSENLFLKFEEYLLQNIIENYNNLCVTEIKTHLEKKLSEIGIIDDIHENLIEFRLFFVQLFFNNIMLV